MSLKFKLELSSHLLICIFYEPCIPRRTTNWTSNPLPHPVFILFESTTVGKFLLLSPCYHSASRLWPAPTNQNCAIRNLIYISTDQSELHNLEALFAWNRPKWELWAGNFSIKCGFSFVSGEHNLGCNLNLRLLTCSYFCPDKFFYSLL